MSNWLENLGIEKDVLDQGVKDKNEHDQKESAGLLQPGVHTVIIDKLWLRETDSESVMLMLEATKVDSDDKLYYSTWVKSGKSGNAYWTKEVNGKTIKVPSSGSIMINELASAIDIPLRDFAPSDCKVNFKDQTVNGKCFKQAIGKKIVVAVQLQENEYDGNISLKQEVLKVMNINGELNGIKFADKFVKKLEKNPIKKLKKKAENNDSKESSTDNGGW